MCDTHVISLPLCLLTAGASFRALCVFSLSEVDLVESPGDLHVC